ncbi:MAG: ABC transporter ATP-binding protein [bacterium]|jgi:peptide/nickel transport system ATP-binding protein
MTVPSLEISRLTVHFGSRENPVWAVENLDINIQKGESFGLVGESGSGKSTVLRAICGLVPIHNGKLRIDGEELKYPRSKSFYQRVQMVFQDPYGSLHPKHTVDRTLNDPLAIHKLDRREYRIGKALDEVGLDESFRFRYPHQLSGGQRQRIAIARALILQPKILLLDEPTSALDASIQAEVLNLLDRLKAERGLTYLMVSHDLAVVSHMCDRLLVMQFGRSVELLDKSSLRDQSPKQQYTMNLLEASKGFRKNSTEK